jgi:hypothetical protein
MLLYISPSEDNIHFELLSTIVLGGFGDPRVHISIIKRSGCSASALHRATHRVSVRHILLWVPLLI